VYYLLHVWHTVYFSSGVGMKIKKAIAVVDDLITCEMEWSDDKKMKKELQKAWNKIRKVCDE